MATVFGYIGKLAQYVEQVQVKGVRVGQIHGPGTGGGYVQSTP